MTKIIKGPGEDLFHRAFLRTVSFGSFGWFGGRKLVEARFLLASTGEEIKVALTEVSFKRVYIHFKGFVVLRNKKVSVKGKVYKNSYPSQGKIFFEK